MARLARAAPAYLDPSLRSPPSRDSLGGDPAPSPLLVKIVLDHPSTTVAHPPAGAPPAWQPASARVRRAAWLHSARLGSETSSRRMRQDYGGTELASRASLSVAANANRGNRAGVCQGRRGAARVQTNSWTSSFLFTLPIAFLGISAAQWHQPCCAIRSANERTNEIAAGAHTPVGRVTVHCAAPAAARGFVQRSWLGMKSTHE